MRLIRSTRSAIAPPRGPAKIEGKNSAAAISPSQAPDSVSSQVSQPTAPRWIQVPISEKTLPDVQMLQLRFEKARPRPARWTGVREKRVSVRVDLCGCVSFKTKKE